MSSVYFPAQVVVLIRRLVNVVSTLSLSNQYLLQRAKREEFLTGGNQTSCPTERTSGVSSWSSRSPDMSEWPWWMSKDNWEWSRTRHVDHYSSQSIELLSNAPGVQARRAALPRVSWGWPAFLSTSNGTDEHPSPEMHQPPPPPPRNSPDAQGPKLPNKDTPPEKQTSTPPDIIHQLIVNPALFDPLRTPRYPIVLCHGLYGFDSRGPSTFPSMRMHYWLNVLNILRDKVKAEVIITAVPGTGSITSRAETLDRQLQEKAHGRGVNLLAHSMGGLDCRHLISHVKPTDYSPVSLTTIATPHRGSPFMDWCADNIGIGKLSPAGKDHLSNSLKSYESAGAQSSESSPKETSPNKPSKAELSAFAALSSLPSSFTTHLLSVLDSPAYANLTSAYLNNVFNPATPDDPRVKYYSVAGRMSNVNIWHPFWLPKLVLDGVEDKERKALRAAWESNESPAGSNPPLWAKEDERGNDGLVTIRSAKWGEFLGTMEGCDHWEMRGARGIEFGVDLPSLPAIGLGGTALGAASVAAGQNENSTSGQGDGWGRFLKAWKKDKVERDAAVNATAAGSDVRTGTAVNRKLEREKERERDDDVIKSSTEKLSAVFDWLVEQVPAPPLLGSKSKTLAEAGDQMRDSTDTRGKDGRSGVQHMDGERGHKKRKHELESKADLERFYVALSRKLYDEGL